MKTKTFILGAISIFAWISLDQSSAATVPAGTTLVVRTLQAISSTDAPGTRFTAQLANSVTVNGKVALPAGAKLSGKVETSRRTAASSQRLTVNITDAQVDGRTVPIKTTGAYQLDNTGFKTRSGASVSRASYHVAAGRKIEFRLAQPLNL